MRLFLFSVPLTRMKHTVGAIGILIIVFAERLRAR